MMVKIDFADDYTLKFFLIEMISTALIYIFFGIFHAFFRLLRKWFNVENAEIA